MTRWGTSHFVSYEKAVSYYGPYHYSNTRMAVDRKLADGEISIGPPTTQFNEGLVVDADGRYWVIEEDKVKA